LGFSMGGIIGRYWLQKFDGHKRTRRLISIGSPHKGTLMAQLIPKYPFKGISEMKISSKFLRELANNDFYLDDSSDSKAMAPIISGLDLIWRNNIDIIALTTDELQDKEKSDLRNEPNYYWNGLIPQTIILNSDGEVKYDKNGMINIDELNKVIGELKGIDIEDTTFSVESFNEYNSIISEKKDKNIN